MSIYTYTQWICIGCGPFTVTVTTRIITCLVGGSYKPSFVTVAGRKTPTSCIVHRHRQQTCRMIEVLGASRWGIQQNLECNEPEHVKWWQMFTQICVSYTNHMNLHQLLLETCMLQIELNKKSWSIRSFYKHHFFLSPFFRTTLLKESSGEVSKCHLVISGRTTSRTFADDGNVRFKPHL